MAGQTVREVIARLRGVVTTPRINRDASQATTTSLVVLKNDPSRIFFLIVNLGAFDVNVAPLGPAANTRGVRLAGAGGAVTAQFDEDGEVVANEWQAIASGGTSALFILESLIDASAPPVVP